MMDLEQDILKTTQLSIQKAISEALTGYNSPLIKLVNKVIDEHSAEIKRLISDALEEAINTEEFQAGVREAFSHKVARCIISDGDSLLKKTSNELKQDAAFRAKLTLAVSNIINEHAGK